MKLKTPAFWYPAPAAPQEQGRTQGIFPQEIFARLLSPLACLYALGHQYNQKSQEKTGEPYACGVPVICIGNIVAGGSGKTPAALALMRLIKAHGLAKHPFFLTRGYGDDEDRLLAEAAPTVVCADRAQGARDAVAQGADMIIMDDGFQNQRLHKDINIIVIDGQMGFGNGRMIPAGPLREPLAEGLARADAFILNGEDMRGVRGILPPEKPLFTAHLSVSAMPPRDKKYIAFAGLGYPQKFFRFLRDDVRLDIVDAVAYADHYAYSDKDIRFLLNKAQEAGATLITTSKDAQRLSVDLIREGDIYVLPVILNWTNEGDLVEFIKRKLSCA